MIRKLAFNQICELLGKQILEKCNWKNLTKKVLKRKTMVSIGVAIFLQ